MTDNSKSLIENPKSPAVRQDVTPPGTSPTAAGVFREAIDRQMDPLLERPVHGIEAAAGVVNGQGVVEGQVSVATKKAGTFALWGQAATGFGYTVMAKWRKTFGGGK